MLDLAWAAMIFKRKFRVHWVDTDIAGVMHFTNYFRYFEACEEEFYRSLGMDLNFLKEEQGVLLPRVEASCQYRVACRFNDEIEVALSVKEVGPKTLTYEFQVLKKGEKAAEGLVKCIATTLDWKVIDLPKEFAQAVQSARNRTI